MSLAISLPLTGLVTRRSNRSSKIAEAGCHGAVAALGLVTSAARSDHHQRMGMAAGAARPRRRAAVGRPRYARVARRQCCVVTVPASALSRCASSVDPTGPVRGVRSESATTTPMRLRACPCDCSVRRRPSWPLGYCSASRGRRGRGCFCTRSQTLRLRNPQAQNTVHKGAEDIAAQLATYHGPFWNSPRFDRNLRARRMSCGRGPRQLARRLVGVARPTDHGVHQVPSLEEARPSSTIADRLCTAWFSSCSRSAEAASIPNFSPCIHAVGHRAARAAVHRLDTQPHPTAARFRRRPWCACGTWDSGGRRRGSRPGSGRCSCSGWPPPARACPRRPRCRHRLRLPGPGR